MGPVHIVHACTLQAGNQYLVCLLRLGVSLDLKALVQGLEGLTRMEILDVSNNQLRRLEGLHTQGRLQDLWVNDNAIQSLDEAAGDLATQKHRCVLSD